MSLLSSNPNPALNEEEVALLELQPEECLRHAVQRGAISLDQVTEELAPRVAAAIRSVVTGERPSSESTEGQMRNFDQSQDHSSPTLTQQELAPYPQLQGLLEAHVLDGAEAAAAAHAIDLALGRYLTGTKYATP